MSDFDEVLERLLGDPAFKARLAADPQGALAGYRLTPDELDILQTQLGEAGGGGQAHVEQRTSKASMFGVFSSIGSGLGDVLHGHGAGVSAHDVSARGLRVHGSGGADLGQRMHDVVEQQAGGRHAALEPAGGEPGGGSIAHAVQDAGGGRHEGGDSYSHTEYHSETHSSGTVYRAGTYTGATGGTPAESAAEGGAGVAAGLGGYQPGGHGGTGLGAGLQDLGQQQPHQGGLGGALSGVAQHAGHAQVPGSAPTDGYHTRVDWDGDGRWDQHTYVNRADGGVDIVVDTNGDGRPEFVGHDVNRDGLIDSSDVDSNSDGVVDARYEDVNGDGWLDRRTR
ncbi:hypothetical protein ABT369_57165 [Dactylosporangium sp. NPDC000244]|uniref:hypothetical protein n=1 Tax=Dactylosporangium sp. NPDC000244 TaxID=3154365 RepID=UPI00331FAB9F